MNKQYYSFGNPFKVKFREHYCYRCGSKLSIVEHHKVVSQKSDEANYYDFSVGADGGIMVGSCEFIHIVYMYHYDIDLDEIKDLDAFVKKYYELN